MLRQPPSPRELHPELITLPARARLVRIHRRNVAATISTGFGVGRFHPLFDSSGKPVETLYAGKSFEAALLETVFRLTPQNVNPRYVRRKILEGYECSSIIAQRPLRLIDLRGMALRRLNVSRADLLDCGPEMYSVTARWASGLYAAMPKADGMVWRSRQLDTADVYVFFEDRIGSKSLRVDGEGSLLNIGAGFIRVLGVAARLGIVITEA